ncbi:hypothetical protein FOVSG1_011952 [Fusarium oxysporum f. sp. vasinfectum]
MDATSSLRADLYNAPAIPTSESLPDRLVGLWQSTVVTLISGQSEAVLVDTLFTSNQAVFLGDWIQETLNGKNLTTIYIPHEHGDHWFDFPYLTRRFPGVQVVSTQESMAHMETQLTPEYRAFWNGLFPGQIANESFTALAKPVKDNKFTLDGHTLEARLDFKLLAHELESPSISTLQCQMLCAVYLCFANFQNMSVCGTVVRTTYMLGLHLDPPETMLWKEREMRRRIWWAVYVLDSKIGMKHGRPFLLSESRLMPKLLIYTSETAIEAGSNFGLLGNQISWLSFHHDQSKLFLAARAAYMALFEEGRPRSNSSVPDGHYAFDDCIEPFIANVEKVAEWARSVLDALKTRRLNS